MKELGLEMAGLIYNELEIKGELSFLEFEKILNLKADYGLNKVQWHLHEELKARGVVFDKDEKGWLLLKLRVK